VLEAERLDAVALGLGPPDRPLEVLLNLLILCAVGGERLGVLQPERVLPVEHLLVVVRVGADERDVDRALQHGPAAGGHRLIVRLSPQLFEGAEPVVDPDELGGEHHVGGRRFHARHHRRQDGVGDELARVLASPVRRVANRERLGWLAHQVAVLCGRVIGC
jgi:hypothetical protein